MLNQYVAMVMKNNLTKDDVDLLEKTIHPEGRCTECGGGKPYWKHGPRGDHKFKALLK